MSDVNRSAAATTMPAALDRHARETPDRVAFRFGAHDLTYAETAAESNRVAHALRRAGVGAESRFAIVDKNRLEFFPLLYGGHRVGAAHVAVSWRLAAPELLHILGESESEVVFVGAELFERFEAIEAELTGVREIVALDPHPRWPLLEAWLDGVPDTPIDVELDPDAIAFQFYTSGTTGLPKGVPISHAAAVMGASEMGGVFGFDADAKSLVVMPTFHIAGSMWSAQATYRGGTNVLLREFEPRTVLETIEREGITHALLVPAMIQFLLEHPDVGSTDFTTLRTITYGASPIAPAHVAEALERFGCAFFQNYGLTETGGAVSLLVAEDHDPARPELLASAGRPVPWMETEVRDVLDGHVCAPREIGEIWTRSAMNATGYWKQPEATAAAFQDGWFRTGDVGYFDEAGYLFLHDRAKDMIVSGGENIYPAEVEHVLVEHPDVVDVAVIGIPSDRWGESVHAVVVRRDGATFTDEELVEFGRERLAGFKLPKSISYTDELPRNPTGKVLKTALREPYWAGRERAIN